LSSREHVNGTIALMEKCGIKFEVCEEDFIYLDGAQAYLPLSDYAIPASQYLSSFSLLAGAIAGRVSLSNCGIAGSQFGQLLTGFGAHFSASDASSSSSAGALSGCQQNAPELGKYLPHAMVLASLASGATIIENISVLPKSAGRRLVLLIRELTRMGAKIAEEENKLIITGGKLFGAKIEPEGDSAVAMACSVAALAAEGQTTISGAECVEKSYPNFFKDLASLGAIVR
jgi:3-phosphoshikimate 1-carboxyvinyltransferase